MSLKEQPQIFFLAIVRSLASAYSATLARQDKISMFGEPGSINRGLCRLAAARMRRVSDFWRLAWNSAFGKIY